MMDHPPPDSDPSLLASFARQLSVLIVGAHGGIGQALLEQLRHHPSVDELHAWSRRPHGHHDDARITEARVDITDETSISAAAATLQTVDLVIVATGLLHGSTGAGPEKSCRDLSADQFAENFMVNAIGPALVAKHVLPRLPRRGRCVFAVLSARVGSIADNRLGGWYSYRASKAALNQIIRSLSIEMARSRPEAICVGLHPGTVDTRLSAPFQGNVPPAKLFSPDRAAAHLLAVINGLDQSDTGGLFAWNGERIPY